jgi:hypothetical protein
MGHLDQNTGAVTRGLIASTGTAVSQIDQNLQGINDQRMAFAIADVADHAHTAGIMVECRVVKAGFKTVARCTVSFA